MTGEIERRYYGRDFTAGEMTLLRALIAADPQPTRAGLSREFCRRIGWFKPDSGLKDMMARVTMLAMHRDGLIDLPPPKGPRHRPKPMVFGPDTEPPLLPIPTTLLSSDGRVGQTEDVPTLLYTHDCGDGVTDPLGRFLDFPVPKMCVAQRRADIGMPEQPGDHRNRHAVHHRVTGMGMAEIVKANILDARLAPGAIPERKVAAAGQSGISRRRKDVRASAARTALENAPGLGIEGNDPGPGLAVGKIEKHQNLL